MYEKFPLMSFESVLIEINIRTLNSNFSIVKNWNFLLTEIRFSSLTDM